MTATGSRCDAAHPDDDSPCDRAPDSVRIIDAAGSEVFGCLHHGATLLASLAGGRVYPGSGSAIEAYRRARTMKPFPFLG